MGQRHLFAVRWLLLIACGCATARQAPAVPARSHVIFEAPKRGQTSHFEVTSVACFIDGKRIPPTETSVCFEGTLPRGTRTELAFEVHMLGIAPPIEGYKFKHQGRQFVVIDEPEASIEVVLQDPARWNRCVRESKGPGLGWKLAGARELPAAGEAPVAEEAAKNEILRRMFPGVVEELFMSLLHVKSCVCDQTTIGTLEQFVSGHPVGEESSVDAAKNALEQCAADARELAEIHN